MKEPVDHIIRPRLPWRIESRLTECGCEAALVRVITRDEFQARLKKYGRQRTGLVTCMTCMSTASRWPAWQEDPRLAVSREVEWEAPYWTMGRAVHDRRGSQLKDELLAIESLIAAHPDEFLKLLSDNEARRQWLERKEPAKPKKPTIVHW